MDSKYFTATLKGNKINTTFKKQTTASTFGRMDFYSRILHSLVPDKNRVWRKGDRLQVEIKGWPKNIVWARTSQIAFDGTITNVKIFNLEEYVLTLSEALEGIIEGESLVKGIKNIYRFSIGDGEAWAEYRFHSKARTIAALCVLYDLEPHPRNDLELNIEKRLGLQAAEWPVDYKSTMEVRTYGDPSKTADELRNEGWSRSAPNMAMEVFRQSIGGQQQQMYKLLQREQTVASQMMRTNIPSKWKHELYKSQDYTCRICNIKYSEELLEPDHRIPVIVRPDGLTDDNFKEKLMTLCRFCNQQKRETCKILVKQKDYDWDNSPWCYPEKFALDKIKYEIRTYSKNHNVKFDEVLNLLKK